MGKIGKVTDIADIFIKSKVKEGSTLIDATCGNGNDTLYLSALAGRTGDVYAFDIQDKAIENTKKLLSECAEHENYKVIKDSFINIASYINQNIDFIIYNLGYLPGGDKGIITNSVDTIISINKALNILSKDGMILICSYRGHDGGYEEYLAIYEYLKSLSKKEYNTAEFKHLNRSYDSPVLFVIEKI